MPTNKRHFTQDCESCGHPLPHGLSHSGYCKGCAEREGVPLDSRKLNHGDDDA